MSKNNRTVDRIQAVWNILGGEEGVDRLIRGEVVLKLIPRFPIWKTIKLSTCFKTAEDFRNALSCGGYRVGNWGNDILGQHAFQESLDSADREAVYELCVASTKELTGKDGATYAEIMESICKVGKLCPAWMGPLLRINYPDQPKNDWFCVAMEPITDSDGDLNVFSVGRGGSERWLDGNDGHPGYFWCGGYRWLFLRSK